MLGGLDAGNFTVVGQAGDQPAYWQRVGGAWSGVQVATVPEGFTGGSFAGGVLGELDIFMGSSHNGDPLTGVATMWAVNVADITMVVDRVIDMNLVVVDLPLNTTTSFIQGQAEVGDCYFMAVYVNTGASARGTPQPHAAILTPVPQTPGDIPAVSTWGMMVLALLVLSAGAVVVGRRRHAA